MQALNSNGRFAASRRSLSTRISGAARSAKLCSRAGRLHRWYRAEPHLELHPSVETRFDVEAPHEDQMLVSFEHERRVLEIASAVGREEAHDLVLRGGRGHQRAPWIRGTGNPPPRRYASVPRVGWKPNAKRATIGCNVGLCGSPMPACRRVGSSG